MLNKRIRIYVWSGNYQHQLVSSSRRPVILHRWHLVPQDRGSAEVDSAWPGPGDSAALGPERGNDDNDDDDDDDDDDDSDDDSDDDASDDYDSDDDDNDDYDDDKDNNDDTAEWGRPRQKTRLQTQVPGRLSPRRALQHGLQLRGDESQVR